MSLVWREQLSVGNDMIDSDHKHFFEIINQVERGLETKNRSELTDAFNSLLQYSKTHFDNEERIASAAGYSQVSRLHQSHDELFKKLDQMKQEVGEKWTESSAKQLTAFLRSWLVDHIIKEDLLMKPALKKHSPRFDPR